MLRTLALSLLLATSTTAQAGAIAEKLDTTRAALEKWVETERILARRKAEWELGRQLLTDRIDLVRSQTEALRAKTQEAKQTVATADARRAELDQENQTLIEVAKGLAGTVAQLEQRIKELLPRLPDPARSQIERLSQQLPDDPAATELSLGIRYQNVVGILNELDKFNREIHVTSEVRTLANGTTAEVDTMYVGLGQAYYATAKGDAAGVGGPTDGAGPWTWTPANAGAADIAKAIAIYKAEQRADFVGLPVRIK